MSGSGDGNGEQQLIYELHRRITSKKGVLDLIPFVQNDYPQSVVLQYYLGYYYEQMGQWNLAEEQYEKCISLNQLFTPPYMNLGKFMVDSGRVEEAWNLFSLIYCKKVLDPTSQARKYVFNLIDNVKICSLMGPALAAEKKGKLTKKAENIYLTLLGHLEDVKTVPLEARRSYLYYEAWMNICKGLGNIYMSYDTDKAQEYFSKGLSICKDVSVVTSSFNEMEKRNFENVRKELVQSYILGKNYNVSGMDEKELKIGNSIVDEVYGYVPFGSDGGEVERVCGKIEIFEVDEHGVLEEKRLNLGYISPDFNKNAVGFFASCLLKYYNPCRFNVFVYYTHKEEDEFTQIFKSYPCVTWVDAGHMSDNELYEMIKNKHKIDILIDLICHGVGGKMELMAKSPAPVIINYLGFPDTSHLSSFTHRITDKLADPNNEDRNTEKLLYMPRSFLCWRLFDGMNNAPIKYKGGSGNIHIGVFNRCAKQHKFIRSMWKRVLDNRKNYILCLKLGPNETNDNNPYLELYKDFPKKQIKYLPFTPTLQEYFDQHNEIDFCADTYPYSGTTTTCSSLYMGVPVYTVYNKNNPHVANVTASLLLNMGDQYKKYACNNFSEYVQKMSRHKMNKDEDAQNAAREEIRRDFLKLMDPQMFMADFENLLFSIDKI